MELQEGVSREHEYAYAFLAESLSMILGDDLVSLFAYGSEFFPRPHEWRSDLDLHVVCRGPLTEMDIRSIKSIHAQVEGHIRGEIDAWYIGFEEAKLGGFPRHLIWQAKKDTSWALHRAHMHAGRSMTVEGLDAQEFTLPPSWEECLDGLRHELAFIEDSFKPSAYAALNLTRILYSLESRNVVVSKYEAAQWGLASLDQSFQPLIELALDYYCGGRRPGDYGPSTALLTLVKSALR